MFGKTSSAASKLRLTLMVIFNILATIVQKFLFEGKADGKDSKMHLFWKPIFQTLLISIGLLLALAIHVVQTLLRRRHAGRLSIGPEPVTDDGPRTLTLVRIVGYSVLPGLSTAFSTLFTCVGLCWLTVSSWSILKYSFCFFPAIFSALVLGNSHARYFWASLVIIVVGLALVVVAVHQAAGTVSIDEELGKLDIHALQQNTLVGVAFTVGGQVIGSCQPFIESFFFDGTATAPMFLIGLEGVWSTIVAAIFLAFAGSTSLAPGSGLFEDTADTFKMIGNSTALPVSLVVLVVFVLIQTGLRGLVVDVTSSKSQSVGEVLRVTVVWILELIVGAFRSTNFGKRRPELGERWSNWSFLELVGFIIASLGILTHNRAFDIKFFGYKPPGVSEEPLIEV
jgi:drug/metabolite transporter (DMT)-like permease